MTKLKARTHMSAVKTNSSSPRQWGTVAAITSEQRERMIAEAAYYIAEQRNFQGGDPTQDWLQAEAEIDHSLNKP